MVMTRSSVTPSGMTATKCRPICAQARARAMQVEPLEASTTVSPGQSVP